MKHLWIIQAKRVKGEVVRYRFVKFVPAREA